MNSPISIRKPAQRGFTLLEVLVATAIMGIAVAGVMSGLAQSTRNVALLTQYDRAAYLARQRMDEMLTDQTLPRGVALEGLFAPAQTSGIEMGWNARVDPFETYGQGVAGTGWVVDRVALEIWWNDAGRRRSFSLEGYRRGGLRPQDASLPVIMNSGTGGLSR